MQSGFVSSTGDFTWTPAASDVGSHTLTFTAYDGQGHTATKQVTITVVPVGSVTALTPTVLSAPVSQTTTTTTAVTAPTFTFTEYLLPGSQDNEVLMLQKLLQREGFLTATPTGFYGAATETAVENFQAAHGLDKLGVIGPSTRAVLNKIEQSLVTAAPTTPAASSTSSAVSAELQSELAAVEQLLQQIQAEIQKMQAGQ